MFVEIKKVRVEYTRTSKLKKSHAYSRTQTWLVLRCDSCESLFERLLSRMDAKRKSNRYYHVCPNCDAKRFAQKKGVDRRKLWDLPVDSETELGRI
jgi:hypothetical protein